jgi:hypothetical protein
MRETLTNWAAACILAVIYLGVLPMLAAGN